MDVSDRRLHVQLTQEAKITSDFSLIRAIFAFAGFVSALRPLSRERPFSSFFTPYIFPSWPMMSRATTTPVTDACIRPRVTPAPSPMA